MKVQPGSTVHSASLHEGGRLSTSHRRRVAIFPLVMWLMLWMSINTGPWQFKQMPVGVLGWMHTIRAAFPMLVLVIAGSMLLSARGPGWRVTKRGPLLMWLVYGGIGLFAAFGSPNPFDAAYWGLAYLASIVVLGACVGGVGALRNAGWVFNLTMLTVTALLVMLVFVARDALFVGEGVEMTGYGVINRAEGVAGIGMSRSSGLARFAAVPGIAAFVMIWASRGLWRLLWAVPVVLAGALIYFMQSRGAIVGYVFAMVFVMAFGSKRTRIVGVLAGVLFLLAVTADMIPEPVWSHITRGQEIEEMRSMTGRTRAWENGWAEVIRSPIWGWGPQSDRYLIGEHVHNTYMYALMQSGFLGVAFFTAGMIWAWVLFYRILRAGPAKIPGQAARFMQAGGILAFFTVRSIPEVCGAMFGVDLLVMLPVLAYLDILSGVTSRSSAHASVHGRSMRPMVPLLSGRR